MIQIPDSEVTQVMQTWKKLINTERNNPLHTDKEKKQLLKIQNKFISSLQEAVDSIVNGSSKKEKVHKEKAYKCFKKVIDRIDRLYSDTAYNIASPIVSFAEILDEGGGKYILTLLPEFDKEIDSFQLVGMQGSFDHHSSNAQQSAEECLPVIENFNNTVKEIVRMIVNGSVSGNRPALVAQAGKIDTALEKLQGILRLNLEKSMEFREQGNHIRQSLCALSESVQDKNLRLVVNELQDVLKPLKTARWALGILKGGVKNMEGIFCKIRGAYIVPEQYMPPLPSYETALSFLALLSDDRPPNYDAPPHYNSLNISSPVPTPRTNSNRTLPVLRR